MRRGGRWSNLTNGAGPPRPKRESRTSTVDGRLGEDCFGAFHREFVERREDCCRPFEIPVPRIVVRDHDAGDPCRARGTKALEGVFDGETACGRLAEGLARPKESIGRRLVEMVVSGTDDHPKAVEKSDPPQYRRNRIPAGARRERERSPFAEIAERLPDTGEQAGVGLENLPKEPILSPLQI